MLHCCPIGAIGCVKIDGYLTEEANGAKRAPQFRRPIYSGERALVYAYGLLLVAGNGCETAGMEVDHGTVRHLLHYIA